MVQSKFNLFNLKFSIIICTHNPNSYLLGRLLYAINYFDSLSTPYEVIIVDNNSTPSLSNSNEVALFLQTNKNVSIIFEKKPGLTSARTSGINASKYDWIVFFDDDNEPHESYLFVCSGLVKKYSQIGVWGPGKISVEFNCKPNVWLLRNKYIFQDKNEDELKYDNKLEWQEWYPYGTGMLVKREIALTYVERVREGRYTLSDRKGKSLSSGGDVQVVLTAIDKGYKVGISPDLQLTHLINSTKTNLSYIIRQQYGTASASILAYNQVFTDAPIKLNYIKNSDILLRVYSLFKIYKKKLDKRNFKILLASKLGEFNASVYASGQSKPLLLKLYERMINV